jgi:hypothetical protein
VTTSALLLAALVAVIAWLSVDVPRAHKPRLDLPGDRVWPPTRPSKGR